MKRISYLPLRSILRSAGLALTVTALTTHADAVVGSYYVGTDDLTTFTSGVYTGLSNPNFNRLTFLYAHPNEVTPSSSHYHSKAIYRYTGTPPSHTETFTVSDYVPEGALPPIQLSIGTGTYANKLLTNPYTNPADPVYDSSFLEIAATNSLNGFTSGTVEDFMFNSSSGRWNTLLDGDADLHIELVSLTPGLFIGGISTLDIGLNNPGDDHHLGGGNFTPFTPVLYTDEGAAPGIYEAKFKLTDESATYGDSGEFRVRVEVVPEPSSALLALVGASAMLIRRRNR